MKKLKTIKISPSEVKSIINTIPFTAFFGVKFIKANGELRKMNCNRSISKGLKYQKQSSNVSTSKIIVFDINVKTTEGSGAYRYVNLDTITEIRTNKKRYIVV